jgi:hypothetical protein
MISAGLINDIPNWIMNADRVFMSKINLDIVEKTPWYKRNKTKIMHLRVTTFTTNHGWDHFVLIQDEITGNSIKDLTNLKITFNDITELMGITRCIKFSKTPLKKYRIFRKEMLIPKEFTCKEEVVKIINE